MLMTAGGEAFTHRVIHDYRKDVDGVIQIADETGLSTP